MIFTKITKNRATPDPDAPRAENTAGVLMEHFDLAPPYEDGQENIVYGFLYQKAREAAASAGWVFRSYSSRETPGCDADFIQRNIRHFPTLILYRDGIELGRHTAVFNTVPGILFWGNTLLGIDYPVPPRPRLPKEFTDKFHLSPSGLVMWKTAEE